MMMLDRVAGMSRAELTLARDRLKALDRNHDWAMRCAAALERQTGWLIVFNKMPETTMSSEYMPGRRALLEAADPYDLAAQWAYIQAALGVRYRGPYGFAPLEDFYLALAHDDARA